MTDTFTKRMLKIEDVARLLEYTPDHVRRSWRDWVRKYGFPQPLVGLRWEAASIDAWRRRRAEPPPPPPPKGRPAIVTDEDRRRAAERTLDRLSSRQRSPSSS
jgi:DNA-directed RNA polymerase specialized sigma24 family protein